VQGGSGNFGRFLQNFTGPLSRLNIFLSSSALELVQLASLLDDLIKGGGLGHRNAWNVLK